MHRLKNESQLIVKICSMSTRNFASKSKNLYDVLGITPNATQDQIKTAYYKLSKTYHPDMNKDDVAASEKFREVSEAYGVLGNYRLKKLYDKGIIHTAGKEFSHHARSSQRTQAYDMENEANDDPTTKFYKSRLRTEHTGKTKIYDFDLWTSEHYGEMFDKSQKLKKRQHFKMNRDVKNVESTTNRNVSLGFIIGICFTIFIVEYFTVRRKPDDIPTVTYESKKDK